MTQPLSRRALLARAGAIGCSAAASPLVTPITLAAAQGDNRLVVLILRGAMDGLDLLRPLGDPDYAGLRPTLGQSGGHDLDGFFALHPALGDLVPLWRAGELAFAPATSTPYRDRRSHFDGQDMLEAGTGPDAPAAFARTGWLNRALAQMPGAQARTAFAVGQGRALILDGPAPMTQWAPGTTLALGPQAQLLLEQLYGADPLFARPGRTALALAGSADGAADAAGGADGAALAAYVAARLAEDTRLATLSLPGWDTHQWQANRARPALDRLATVLTTLRADLGALWGRTTVLAMTEFGRTAAENGSRGTDHGTGGALLLAGGALCGGRMLGGWPGLAPGDLYGGRDLMPLRDVRAYAAWALRDMFGLGTAALTGQVFPGLDMGADPRLLA